MCNEVVTNPVCMNCVEKEVEAWLSEVRPALVEELKAKTEEIEISFGDTNCILCNDKMCICTYCYTNHIFNWLKKYPELIIEFRMIFDIKKNIKLYECRVSNKSLDVDAFFGPKTL